MNKIDFEKAHEKFDGIMIQLCKECGGLCENEEITLFLPGEAEFAAKKLKINKKEFIKKFCNTIMFKGNEIYILKAGMCPFLNKKKRCNLEKPNCKPLRCLLYPVLIGNYRGKPKIFIDNRYCPMAKKITKEFKRKAYATCIDIKTKIPKWWLEFVSKYDEATYDYSKLTKLRNKKIIKLEELKKCMAKEAEK